MRDPHELEDGYIPSAKNIPLSVLKETLHLEPDAFKERVGHEKPLPHHELVFYCRSGRRAGVACEAALNHGYRKYVVIPSISSKANQLLACKALSTTRVLGKSGASGRKHSRQNPCKKHLYPGPGRSYTVSFSDSWTTCCPSRMLGRTCSNSTSTNMWFMQGRLILQPFAGERERPVRLYVLELSRFLRLFKLLLDVW